MLVLTENVSDVDIASGLICIESGISLCEFRRGWLRVDRWPRVSSALARLAEQHLAFLELERFDINRWRRASERPIVLLDSRRRQVTPPNPDQR